MRSILRRIHDTALYGGWTVTAAAWALWTLTDALREDSVGMGFVKTLLGFGWLGWTQTAARSLIASLRRRAG
jgi:hypothetical protein